MTVGELNVEIGAKLDKLERALGKMEGEINSAGKKSEGTAKKSFGNIAGIIAGAFSVNAIIEFQKKVIELGAEFQKFEAVLTTSLGSGSLAQGALAMIQSFASQTPFSVRELTDAFVKLVNQGFKPTEGEMKRLGDLAASTGKSFDQLAEAIIDAQVGEFERLKEFGIRASKEGDKVMFTFKGVTTEVQNTSESIQDYILSLGDLQGVSGSMAAISDTLGGSISNLGDSFDALLVSISETQGGLKTFIEMVSNGLQGLTASIQAGGILSVDEIFLGKSAGEATFKATISQFDKLIKKFGSSEAALEQLNIQAQKYDELAAQAETPKMVFYNQQLADAYRRAGLELTKFNKEQKQNGNGAVEATKQQIEEWHNLGRIAYLTGEVMNDVWASASKIRSGPIVEMERLVDPEMEEATIRMGQELEVIKEKLDRYYESLSIASEAGAIFGSVLQSSFEAALINGENFFDVFIDGLKKMVMQLIAAAATATILSAILSAFMPSLGFKAAFGQVASGMGGGSGGLGGIFKLFGSDLVAGVGRTTYQQGRVN